MQIGLIDSQGFQKQKS